MGDRLAARRFQGEVIYGRLHLARWGEETEAELLALAGEAPAEAAGPLMDLHLLRGDSAAARRVFDDFAERGDSAHAETTPWLLTLEALVLLSESRPREALECARAAVDRARRDQGMRAGYVKRMLPVALEAALELGDEATIDELLGLIESLPPGRTSPLLRATGSRYAARRAALHSDATTPQAGFAAAEELYRGIPAPLELAATQVEHSEWLAAVGRADEAEPLLAEAEAIYERMGATPWLERIARCRGGAAVGAR